MWFDSELADVKLLTASGVPDVTSKVQGVSRALSELALAFPMSDFHNEHQANWATITIMNEAASVDQEHD